MENQPQKNVLITGSSRGIGLELVREFSAKGHRVLSLSRSTMPLQNLKNTAALTFDITKEEDLLRVKNYVEKNWQQVDVLIHNAGQIIKDDFENIVLDDLKKIYDTNVFGVYRLTQVLFPYFHKNSHIVAVSSMGGIQGSVKFPGLTAYSSSKAAVINLMEVLAEEFKESGPVFNALALGAVQTEMFEAAFPGAAAGIQPAEMAAYICQFALTAHKVYNGKVLPVSNSTP